MSLPDKIGFVQPEYSSHTTQRSLTLAIQAEQHGYDSVMVPETWGRDVFTRLGEIARATDQVDLGTGIIPVHSRSPALIAQSFATLNEMAVGDVFIGLGLSSNYVIESWHGIEFQPALRRQRETIEIIRQVLSGEKVNYEGEIFDVEHFKLRIDPTPPDLPVYVGAQGPTNCRLVGEFADGWFPNRIARSYIHQLREHVDKGADNQNRDPSEIETVPFATSCVLEDGKLAKWRCKQEIAYYIGAMGDYTLNSLKEQGFGDIAVTVNELWQDDDKEAAIDAVSEDLLSEITVSGTPEEVEETLELWEDIGDGIVIQPAKDCTFEETQNTLKNIGNAI